MADPLKRLIEYASLAPRFRFVTGSPLVLGAGALICRGLSSTIGGVRYRAKALSDSLSASAAGERSINDTIGAFLGRFSNQLELEELVLILNRAEAEPSSLLPSFS